ncbi:hypothetical protein E2320_006619 [Naja naja]|nr:hypothetical protein E2320_006619 [Naja naja]
MIEGALDFKTMIDNETLPVEYLGGKPLCMNQYYQILSSCRIPVLSAGCLQQRWEPADYRPDFHSAGKDLEYVPSNQQGAHRDFDKQPSQQLGQSL